MEVSPEQFVELKNRARICYQTFGDASDPAVILLAGHGGSMLDWPEDLIPLFSPEGDRHYVVRYDQRDTGLSKEYPVPAGYTILDMANDVELLAEHLGLSSKGYHVVSVSMGGYVGYTVAGRNPEKVRSLTLMFTSPGVSEELPMGEGIDTGVQPMLGGTGNERNLYIKYAMNLYDGLTTQPDPEERRRAEANIIKNIDRDIRGGTLFSHGPNHGAATWGNWPGVEMLKKIKCPTTVLQSAKDPFFPEHHGKALANAVEGADYVVWDDCGHELPRRIWARLAELLLQTWKKGDDAWGSKQEVKA